jgi:hypothetical protein
LPFCAKKYLKNLKYLEAQTHKMAQSEPAFSVGHFRILHVNSMFGKYG